MQAVMQSGIEGLVSRKTLFRAGVAAWAGGVVLASAAGFAMTHHARMLSPRGDLGVEVDTRQADTAQVEQAGPPAEEVMPQDTVVASKPQAGAAEMQSK